MAGNHNRFCRPAWFVVPALVLAIAGCVLGQSMESGSLAGACQLRACECASPQGPFGTFADIKPVQWEDDGNATCPEGYRLRVVGR